MKLAIYLGALALLPIGNEVATRYDAGRSVRVESETSLELETTDFQMERDGEPVEGRFGSGGGGMESVHTVAFVDRILEAADGAPTRVRRTFETAEARRLADFRGEPTDDTTESPLADATLEIAVDEDGEVSVEVVEGDEPDSLEGHLPTLALDALLPADAVEEGESWDLEQDQIQIALGMSVQRAMFPRPEGGGDERGGRGGGGGRRGFGGGRGGGRDLEGAEWEGRATLASLDATFDGRSVYRIALEIEGLGETDEEGSSTSVEVTLEGQLLFDPELSLPVLLELEGDVTIESHRERDWGESAVVIDSTREGTFLVNVAVTETEDEE